MYGVYDYGIETHTHTLTQLVTPCPVTFVTTCPSVIFLFATGLSPPCLRY